MNGIKPHSEFKQYLGDGAYVDFDGFAIILTTEDGVDTTNVVVLEPGELKHFEEWLDRLRSNVDTPGPAECPTCQGTGIESQKTWNSPEIQCEDCQGRGTK